MCVTDAQMRSGSRLSVSVFMVFLNCFGIACTHMQVRLVMCKKNKRSMHAIYQKPRNLEIKVVLRVFIYHLKVFTAGGV